MGTILVSGVALNGVHSDVSLTNGVLALVPLTAEIFGGKETGGITVDMRSQPAKVALNTNLSEMDAQKLLADNAKTDPKRPAGCRLECDGLFIQRGDGPDA